jgi:hypothetical protein
VFILPKLVEFIAVQCGGAMPLREDRIPTANDSRKAKSTRAIRLPLGMSRARPQKRIATSSAKAIAEYRWTAEYGAW